MEKQAISKLLNDGYDLGLKLPTALVDVIEKKIRGFTKTSPNKDKWMIYLKGLEMGVNMKKENIKARKAELAKAKSIGKEKSKGKER